MTSFGNHDTYHVLILKADRLCASILQQTAQHVFAAADIRVTTSLAAATQALSVHPVNLLITGLALFDGDALELFNAHEGGGRNFRHALVITGRREHRVLGILRNLSINGVFDPMNDDLQHLETAMRQVGCGGRYWSPTVLARLSDRNTSAGSLSHLLSPTEQLVLAVIGDGSDDITAAARLNLRPSTIHSVRRELHRKLGVQHKGELVRVAVQHGYVRFTADGVQRPGFSNLLAACGRR